MTTTAIKERPILFSGEMVRAILDGRKTQTRRVVKLPRGWSIPPARFHNDVLCRFGVDEAESVLCPYGVPGDRLWVRETWQQYHQYKNGRRRVVDTPALPQSRWSNRVIEYAATCDSDDLPRWRPSIHMPRWASRITLQITDVRVEHVQEITHEDARAEGVEDHPLGWKHYVLSSQAYTLSPRSSFSTLWDSINGNRGGCSWTANPWVWVVDFEKVSR